MKKGIRFPAIAAVTLRERVIDVLKDAMFTGALKPGDPIVERQLAKDLNIGTLPVREALITLHEQGLVRRITNTATYVVKYTVEEVQALYALRVELELVAFRWAKQRITEADLEHLEAIVQDMTKALKKGQVRRFHEHDLSFHRHCWGLAGNRFLAETLERIVIPLFVFVLMSGETTGDDVVMVRRHESLIHAFRKFDEPKFSAAVRATMDEFGAVALERIQSYQPTA